MEREATAPAELGDHHDDDSPPAWLESEVLFHRFWVRLPATITGSLAAVGVLGLLGGWDRLHQWTSGLMIAGLAAWILAVVLFTVATLVLRLRTHPDAEFPPGIRLLPFALVLVFAGLGPLGLGMILATVFT